MTGANPSDQPDPGTVHRRAQEEAARKAVEENQRREAEKNK